MTSEIGDDAITAWVQAVREQQRQAECATQRDDLIEALGHACRTAIRLRDTAHYGRAHQRINELLDELVGL